MNAIFTAKRHLFTLKGGNYELISEYADAIFLDYISHYKGITRIVKL